MRKSRFYQISGNFRSGVLSPAAQDDITREDWLNGAAELTNFDILRDGGIRTRPRLVRPEEGDDELLLPVLRRKTQDILGSVTPSGPPWTFSTEAGTLPRDGTAFLTFDIVGVEGVPGRNNVRSVTFEGMRLRQGPWRVGAGDGQQLVFGMEVLDRNGVWQPTDRRTEDRGDPFSRYALAPGRVRRDIVAQIPLDGEPSLRRLRGVRLRVVVDPDSDGGRQLADPGNRLELEIQDIKIFDGRPSGAPPLPDLEYRIIPWSLRGFDLALIVAQEQMMVVGNEREPRNEDGTIQAWAPKPVVPKQSAWSFTPKQLRELDWTPYGSHLILSHEEFPYPLEVRLADNGQLSVEYLKLTNLPQLPARLAQEARLDVSLGDDGRIKLDQPKAPSGAIRAAEAPHVFRLVPQVGGLGVSWSDVGADRYQVYVQTEATYAALPAETAWDLVTPIIVTSTSTTLTGLVGGTEYRVAVASQVDVGPNSIESTSDPADADDRTATVLEAQLAAPVLAATASTTTDGVIRLSWGLVTGATGFRLETRAGQGAWVNAAQQPAGAATSLDFVGTPGTLYSFRLYATSGDAPASVASNVAQATAPSLVPAVPSGLKAEHDANVNGREDLQWDAAALAQSYDVEIANDAAFGDLLPGFPITTSARSFSRTFTHANGVYAQQWWRVRSQRITAGGVLESAWEDGTFTPAWVPLNEKPTNLRVASIRGVSGIHWDWVRYGGGLLKGNPTWQIQYGYSGVTPEYPERWFGIETLGRTPARPFVSPTGTQLVGLGYKVRVRALHVGAPEPRVLNDTLGPWSDVLQFVRTA